MALQMPLVVVFCGLELAGFYQSTGDAIPVILAVLFGANHRGLVSTGMRQHQCFC